MFGDACVDDSAMKEISALFQTVRLDHIKPRCVIPACSARAPQENESSQPSHWCQQRRRSTIQSSPCQRRPPQTQHADDDISAHEPDSRQRGTDRFIHAAKEVEVAQLRLAPAPEMNLTFSQAHADPVLFRAWEHPVHVW
eukprot:397341-Amphidinium_carterae.1